MKYLLLIVLVFFINELALAEDESGLGKAAEYANSGISSLQQGLRQIKFDKIKQSYLPQSIAQGKERKYMANSLSSTLKTLKQSFGVTQTVAKLDWAKSSLKGNISNLISSSAKNGLTVFQGGLEIATTGANTVGYLSGGDVVAAASEAANGAAKSFVVSGSMAAGAFIGSFIPVPVVGTCLGGAVGAAMAGWGSGQVYDNYLKPFIEGIAAAGLSVQQDPRVTAWLNKHSPELKQMQSDYGSTVGFDSNFQVAGADSEIQLPSGSALNTAMGEWVVNEDNQPSGIPTPLAGDAGKPIIPIDCTILTEQWHPDSPKYKSKVEYRILDGKVDGAGVLDGIPTGCTPSPLLLRSKSHGTIKDNVLSLEVITKFPPLVCQGAGCVAKSSGYNMRSEDQITLNENGTLTNSYYMQPSTDSWSYSGCGTEKPQGSYTAPSQQGTLLGRWRIKH